MPRFLKRQAFYLVLEFLFTGLLSISVKGEVPDPLAPSTLTGTDGKSVLAVKCYPNGRMKGYCMSFDDGTLVTDAKIIAILNKYGLKATFFINSQHPQSQDALKNPTVYEGHEIASHGAHHQGLDHLSLEEAKREVTTDQQILGDIFHCQVQGFAYPYGAVPKTGDKRKELEDMLASLGIRYARWTNGGSLQPPDRFMTWKPGGGIDANAAGHYVKMPVQDHILLLTAWGHSRDLEKDKGWEKADMLCQLLADSQSLVWMGTYLEITKYVEALRAVKIENGEIYNPSSDTTIWVRLGGKSISIKSGEHWHSDEKTLNKD